MSNISAIQLDRFTLGAMAALEWLMPGASDAEERASALREILSQSSSMSTAEPLTREPAPVKAKRAAALTFDTYIPMRAAAIERCMGDHGLRWDLVPGASYSANVPSKWVNCKIYGGIKKGPRDLRVPAARYWPNGEYPAGMVVAEHETRETGPIVFGSRWDHETRKQYRAMFSLPESVAA